MSFGGSVECAFSAWLGGGFLRPAGLFRSDLAVRGGPLEQIALRDRLGGRGKLRSLCFAPRRAIGFLIDPGRNKSYGSARIDQIEGWHEVRAIPRLGDGQWRLFRFDAFDFKVVAADQKAFPLMGDADAHGFVRDQVQPVDLIAACMGRMPADVLAHFPRFAWLPRRFCGNFFPRLRDIARADRDLALFSGLRDTLLKSNSRVLVSFARQKRAIKFRPAADLLHE